MRDESQRLGEAGLSGDNSTIYEGHFLHFTKNTTSAIQPVFPLLYLQDKTAQLGTVLPYIIIWESTMCLKAGSVCKAATCSV